MGKVPQGCAAAALAAPSSTGEGTLGLIFLIFLRVVVFFLNPPDFSKIKTLSFVYFLKTPFTSFQPLSKCTKRMEN